VVQRLKWLWTAAGSHLNRPKEWGRQLGSETRRPLLEHFRMSAATIAAHPHVGCTGKGPTLRSRRAVSVSCLVGRRKTAMKGSPNTLVAEPAPLTPRAKLGSSVREPAALPPRAISISLRTCRILEGSTRKGSAALRPGAVFDRYLIVSRGSTWVGYGNRRVFFRSSTEP